MNLTELEQAILQKSAELWNLFCTLPDKHPADSDETARDLHNIQNRVMARCAVRNTRPAHPFYALGEDAE